MFRLRGRGGPRLATPQGRTALTQQRPGRVVGICNPWPYVGVWGGKRVDPGAIEQTRGAVKEGAAVGKDPEFGRGEDELDRAWGDTSKEGAATCLASLEGGPFHATRVYAGCSGTTGGPKVDASGHVL